MERRWAQCIGVTLLTVWLVPLARAEDSPKELCKGATTQLEINTCTAAERDRVEAVLAAKLKELQAKLSEKEWQDLDKVQQAWRQYKKLNCAAEEALYEGGSIRPTILAGCQTGLTEQRISELHRIYEDPDR